ncbi:MAG TPA: putative baseplate assembly protein [Blastocatellia bacterium]|nr:putative baseplate assembly protein [Blastocatellia bacterium]
MANRPGLGALVYRVGTHATFFETMKARLASRDLPELAGLTTREGDDPAIALLDAWATVADVLTFYQERIANEGYLRTATERRSILELARLVGYRPRPGVAASTHLALTLEDGHDVAIEPLQLRAQSVPGPGELPQTFENVERLDARARWNKLRPRLTRPQRPDELKANAVKPEGAKLYLKGIATGLDKNDPLLIIAGGQSDLFRVVEVRPDATAERTLVTIRSWLPTNSRAIRGRINEIVSAAGDVGAAGAALEELRARLDAGMGDAELADFIERETLPALSRSAARRNVGAELRARLLSLHAEAGEAARALRVATPDTLTAAAGFATAATGGGFDELKNVVKGLTKAASVPPANALRLARDAQSTFSERRSEVGVERSDAGLQLFGAFRPQQRDSIAPALANSTVAPPLAMEVYALRVKARPFGHNTPKRIIKLNRDTGEIEETGEWPILKTREPDREEEKTIFLDAVYDKILPESLVVIDSGAVQQLTNADLRLQVTAARRPLLVTTVVGVEPRVSRGEYGMSGNVTRLSLGDAWLRLTPGANAAQRVWDQDFKVIRGTAVYAQSEKLELAEAPIEEAICNEGADSWIHLDGVYSELKSGRWVIVAGERADIADEARTKDGTSNKVAGVRSAELVMLAEVVHSYDPGLPGDRVHTRVRLARKLEYCYRREGATIYANVVRATHGETRRETLGGGDGSQAMQRFALRQPPLTYVSSATPAGSESTLKIFVNDVQWHEAEMLFSLAPAHRSFITRRGDDEVTTAIFGNGRQGARLPTGAENVRAEYRQGIGKAANVRAEQITQLTARPLGVKDVINPLRASGGADREGRDQARKNAPLAVLALDRLVSTQDYADFARTFAGIGKAYATRLSDGRRQLVHLTIAGADDIPIDETSDLWQNLPMALRRFGDPGVAVTLAVRELALLIVSAKVRLLPDYLWEKVEPKIRAKLLDLFSFERRELGQDAFSSEAISAMQSIAGVAWVDVDAFGSVAERNDDGTVRTPKELLDEAEKVVAPGKPNPRVKASLPETGAVRPAQLVYLSPDVQDTLILNLI